MLLIARHSTTTSNNKSCGQVSGSNGVDNTSSNHHHRLSLSCIICQHRHRRYISLVRQHQTVKHSDDNSAADEAGDAWLLLDDDAITRVQIITSVRD